MLDTLRQVETPEGLALKLRCAGVVPRALAWLFDLLLRMLAVGAVLTVLGLLGGAGAGIAMLVMFVLYWGYPVVFEVLRDGQTPGKRLLGLRVLNDNGTPVTWLPSIVRNLLRTVDMMPMLYGFGLASSLADRHGRRLGDLAAGTLVVYVDKVGARVPAPPVAALAPPLALHLDEQSAIVAFAERSPQMTGERQEELANLLAPVLRAQGAAAVQRLLGMANYLLGRR